MLQKTQNPATLYLIRHGEPDCQYHNCYYGQMDVPLSDRGMAQSRAMAERLASVPFDAIYSSDLQRAGYLAELLAEPRDLPVRRLEVFRERHMGQFQGIPIEVLKSEHSEGYNAWLADRVNYRFPDAENFIDLGERIIPAIQELAASFAGRRIALIGHAGPIRVTLAHALGIPLENLFRISINHCGINVIDTPPASRRV